MLRRLFRWIQPVALILSVVAIGWFLVNQWPVLRNYHWRLDWGWLLATGLFTVASWGLEIAIWQHLVWMLGGKVPYWAAARMWFLSAVLRYIPGNVWQPLSLTLYARRHGVAPEATITSIVLFQVLAMLSVVPILVAYFLWIDTKSLASQFVAHLPIALIWLAIVPVVAFLVRPQWLVLLLNWALARLKRPPLAMQITSLRLLTLTVIFIFNWLLWGGVFASFTFAVAGDISGPTVGDSFALAPLLIAAFPIASIIGFLSFITPSGFGVREGAFYLLLTPQIAGSVVTVIALGIRVWGIVNELFFALLSAPFEQAFARQYDQARMGEVLAPLDTPLRESAVTADLRRETT